jgi:hypothetical protein
MHNCEEFRERITELIIDREDVAKKAEFQSELLMCSSCLEFYVQSRELIEALDGIDLTISDKQWNGIEQRLHARILNVGANVLAANVGAGFSGPRAAEAAFRPTRRLKPAATATSTMQSIVPLLATAALLLITIGLGRFPSPIMGVQQTAAPAGQAVYVEHSVPLDPVTVGFLEESELLLRNVMKMAPSDVEDLADAKKAASEQLAELDQRKEAAAEVPPVVGVMETYETILRDLRNVDIRSADEDIGDIQKRIQQNGLIANMKAFQPRVTEVGFSLR